MEIKDVTIFWILEHVMLSGGEREREELLNFSKRSLVYFKLKLKQIDSYR
jgi:hypothetical protein